MSEQRRWDSEQEAMERWRSRLAFWRDVAVFFRQSVILDVVCPIGGVIALAWLLITGSDSYPLLFVCGGAIGLPGCGAFADWLVRRGRPPR